MPEFSGQSEFVKHPACLVNRNQLPAGSRNVFHFITANNSVVIPCRLTYSLMRPLFPVESAADTPVDGDIAMRRLSFQKPYVEEYVSVWNDNFEQPFPKADPELLKLLKKKPARALQRLKEKGLYAADLKSFWAFMERGGGMQFMAPFSTYVGLLGGVILPADTFQLTDEMWISAIELYMGLECPEIFLDPANDDQWIGYIQRNLSLLFTFVLYISLLSYFSTVCYENMDALNSVAGEINDTMAASMDVVELQDTLSRVVNALEDSDNEVAALKARIRELELENQRAHIRADALERKCEKLASGQDASDDSQEPELVVPSAKTDDLAGRSAEFSAEKDLLDLPEDGILFIGGHPNMLSKLKPMHSGWTFVTTDVSVAALPRDMRPKCAFVYSTHLSHSLFARLRQHYAGIPTCYVGSTNMDMLHHEMQVLYTVSMRKIKHSGGDE